MKKIITGLIASTLLWGLIASADVHPIAERLSQKYIQKISRLDSDTQIQKIQRLTKKIQLILLKDPHKYPYKKAIILVDLNNTLCTHNNTLGGPRCSHINISKEEKVENPTFPQNEIQASIDVINIERKKIGSGKLTSNSRLSQAAKKYADILCKTQHLSHTGPNGSTPASRANEAGYMWTSIGENIGTGYSHPQKLINAFMQSPGHRDNMLRNNYTEAGVGRCNKYWVVMFGAQ